MARLIAVMIILFPLSFVRVDQRGSALLPMVIQLEKNSPAFAAFEDLQNEFPETHHLIKSNVQNIRLAAGSVYTPEIPSQVIETNPVAITLSLNTMKISRPQVAVSLPEWDDSENMPALRDRKEMLLSELSREMLKQESPTERAAQLVKRELAQMSSDVRSFKASSGSTVVIKKPAAKEAVTAPYVASHSNAYSEGSSPVLVTGTLTVDGGVAEMGPQLSRWTIYREVNGQRHETGVINLLGGQFSIQVSERSGNIVAEVRNAEGRTYGRGQVSLRNEVLALQVTPTQTTVASLANPSAAPMMTRAHQPFHTVDVSQNTEDSRLFVEASTPKHFPTVALGYAQDLKKIPLYTLAAIKAFRSLVKSFYRGIDLTSAAVIWGEVIKDGQPVAGAEVEVASGEGRVIYFNEIGIPRDDLIQTSSAGKFAAVNLGEGVQSIRVSHEGQTYPAYVLPTFAGKLTHLSLEIPTQILSHTLEVSDLRSPDNKVASSLRIVGTEDLIEFENDPKQLTLPDLSQGILIETDSGPQYELLRSHLPRLSHSSRLSLPAISTEWIDQLLRTSGKALDRRLGWAIGFTEDSPLEVTVLNQSAGLYQVIYFDHEFKVSQGDMAPAGGGYLIFNLPLGYQTLEVRGLHSSQSYVESFVSEAYFLNLIRSQRFTEVIR